MKYINLTISMNGMTLIVQLKNKPHEKTTNNI